ncbi:hypothetical protein IB278_25930 [Variovorax sp. VRV01]|uniref:hypothetical protein n=1 Tax=Variovorax sp. VRV01 TaxID=2769259 RepID=UPI0017875F81|nr:hypothetical protein [Variovorax sp. VRV01]MBD9667423.1 hypothetical protein [Variovorax sp. VRV01]
MATKAMNARERRLFNLLVTALDQIQDDQTTIFELIQRDANASDLTKLRLRNIGQTSEIIREELRSMGIGARHREPFDDDTPAWALEQYVHGLPRA